MAESVDLAGKTCVKCPLEAKFTGVDPKKAWYCRECFIQMVKNKFRSALSKKKIYKDADERETLIVFDGSPSGAFLLKQIDDALKQITYKRLMVKPTVLVLVSATDEAVIRSVLKRVAEIQTCVLEKVKWIIFHAAFSMYDELSEELGDAECHGAEKIANYMELLDSCTSPTYRKELERILKEKCLEKVCKSMKISKCMVPCDADDLGRLSIDQLCLGRGGSLSSLVSIVDKRSPHFTLIRPLRDASKKEITIVNYLTEIDKYCIQIEKKEENVSVQSLTDDFIRILEKEKFYSTINTVLSTATKIHPNTAGNSSCVFCHVESDPVCMTCCEIRKHCSSSEIDRFFF